MARAPGHRQRHRHARGSHLQRGRRISATRPLARAALQATQSMKRKHDMRFGATIDRDRVRFALWAAGARTVELELGEGATLQRVPLQPQDDGWHEVVTHAAGGALYRYRLDDELT